MGSPFYRRLITALIVCLSFGAGRGRYDSAYAAEGEISESARREISALFAEKMSWSPTQAKLESQLIHAVKRNRGEPYAPAVTNLQMDFHAETDGRALVDITATVTPGLLAEIEANGGKVRNSFPNFNAVRALVPLAALEKLAALPEVSFISRAAKVRHNADPEGNAVHLATLVRTTFGASGSGVKVGVLSDSVDSLSAAQSTGDLGTVTVLSGQSGVPGTGEGTAMLEIVHAIAPNAQLFFATANNGDAAFAQNILNLRNSGCDIIVDDSAYFDESPFQDSTVAAAVNTVTAGGALYFSSAGNSGNLDSGQSGTWEGDFSDGGAVSSPEVGNIHKFGNLTYDTVGAGGSELRVDLFWSDPLGGATNDYDLFVLNSTGTSVLRSSTTRQGGGQNPYESLSTLNPGERIVIIKFSGQGKFLHLSTGRGNLAIATSGATVGHAAAVKAFDVAAVDVAVTYPNPFTGGPTNPVETFSSDGPRHVFFNQNGSAITPGNFSSSGGAIRQKPDIAAADGVSTSLATFTPFFGTSAAAPHAAAIAALLKSYNPALTPDEIRSVLTTTALDNMAPGVDRDSGFGIVMANTALAAAPPDALLILPGTSVAASGFAGGPFTTPTPLVLTNDGAGTISWSLMNTSTWLNVSTTNGGLTTGGGATVISMAINAAANSLPPGIYNTTLWFTNLTSHLEQSRSVVLTVNPPVHGAYANNILSLAPAGYWRLNETNPVGGDVVMNFGSLGSAANGLGSGGVAQGQPGIVKNAFVFSNPAMDITFFGGHVDVPFQTALNPNGAFTVELWANPAQTVTDLFCPAAAIDITQNSGNSRMGWLVYQNTNGWQFRVGGVSGYTATLSGGSVATNVWHHLAGVYDGVNASFYVDGALVAGPTSASGFSPNQSQPLRIGATTIPNRTFMGGVDEVAFYNTALSAATIAAHHAAVTTNNAGYSAQILASNPLGYWHLDELTAPPLLQATNIGTLAPNANGTYQPGCITGVPGAPLAGLGASNVACQFSGTGFIDIDGTFLNFTGPLTLTAWVKANPANGTSQSVFSQGALSYRLLMDGSGLPHFACGAQPSGDLTGTSRVDDQQWHQWVGVFDGAQTERLYIDAQLVAVAANATNPLNEIFSDVWIGGDPDASSSQFFNGTIDEVAVFSNALTAPQIQQMYSLATNAPAAPSFVSTAPAGGGGVSFSWSVSAGQTYQVQYKTNLTQAGWINLGSPTQAVTTTLTASDVAPGDRQRFYRVVLVE